MENTYTDFKVETEAKEEVIYTVPEAPKVKKEVLTAKQKLKAKAQALAEKKIKDALDKKEAKEAKEKAEKERKRLEAEAVAKKEKELREKEAIELKKIESGLKDLEDKENIILGKWLRESYKDGFTHESLKKLKEKTKLLVEDGIK